MAHREDAGDSSALECYRRVLLELGHVTGYIQWKRLARDWLYKNLRNVDERLVHRMLAEYVTAGGDIQQVRETRPEYLEWRFHYDARISIADRRVYIETVLDQADDLEDCTIWIVNMHDV